MPKLTKLLKRLARDDKGAETLEVAIIAGLIITACLGVVSLIGPKVVARWNSLNSSV